MELPFCFSMLQVYVSFPSGSGETLSLPDHSKVGDLQLLARKTFSKGFLKLVTVEGRVLTDPEESLQAAVQEGEHLTAVAQRTILAASSVAFALWRCGDDQILAWGDFESGGCGKLQLGNVQQVQSATNGAFAAILADGSVDAWGEPDYGGDCSAVQHQLRNVQQLQATNGAFAAILEDGSVVAWGAPLYGGDYSAVQDQLINVQQIQRTGSAFAAILADGSVVAWGHPEYAGDCSPQFKVSSGM